MSTMTTGLTFTAKLHLQAGEKGRLELREGEAPDPPAAPVGRVPKLSRLVARANGVAALLARGEVSNMADVARFGHVARDRVTQIMNRLCLARDNHERLLFLPLVERGRGPVKEWQVRPIAAEPS